MLVITGGAPLQHTAPHPRQLRIQAPDLNLLGTTAVELLRHASPRPVTLRDISWDHSRLWWPPSNAYMNCILT